MARGEYVDPATRKRQEKAKLEKWRKEVEEAKNRPQKMLTFFT
jgi:hypothetical protein